MPAGENTVTYTVEVPGVATKAIADGKNVDYLFYEVYVTTSSTADDLSNATLLYKKDDIRMVQSEVATSRATVTLNLVQNQHYTVLFWAQCGKKSEGVYDVDDLRAVTYKDAASIKSNHEDYAAFYAVDVISDSTPRAKKVYLKRPFAQLNIGTLNTVDYDKDPYTVNMIQSKVTVKQVPTVFNVATSEVDLDSVTDFTFAWETLYLISDEQLAVNDKNYHYVAMNYMFAGIEGRTAKVEYELEAVMTTQGNVDIPVELSKYVVNVPLKENYRTNIVGNLLTSSTEYEVIVDAAWAGDDLAPDPIYMAAANGGNVTLDADVTLKQPLDIKADMTLNLNGKTITGALNVAPGANVTIENGTITNGDKTVSGITTNGILTLNNVTIESARHAVRVESGKVVINGGTYEVKPISNSTLHALNVGDNGTEAEVIIKGGTFIGPKDTMADSGSAVNVRSGSKVTIEGGDFSGGKNKTLACGGTLTVKGGLFDQDPAAFVAEGYKAVSINGKFHVLPEVIADAATNANVTAVTESTADVATALATDNGEATMFMWNDVAYIAKNGEVVIASAADEATTVRGIVEGAAGLKEATVAEGIEVVGNRTFRRCANLETVEFPSTLTEIGPAVFQSCSKLANVTIPASVKTIGEGAFSECASLTSINIPAGVTRIEADALRATGLVSVEFHEGVTYFGAQAFRDCKQLKEVYINAPEFTVEANAFGVMAGALPGTTIYVANAEMKAYLESTLAYANQFNIVATNVVSGKADLKATLEDAVANGEKDIVIDAEGAEFDMNYGLSQANVPAGTTVTIRNANVNDQSYGNAVNGTVIFEDCIFNNPSGAYSIHFDAGSGDVIFKNCDLYGWNSFGSTLNSVSFENCTLKGNGKYALIRSYVALTMKNCTINTSKADHTDAYSEGVEAVNGATLTEENISYVVYDETSLQYALNNAAVSTIYLNPREEAYIADIYNGTTARKSLTIIGSEGTKFGHTATTGGQLRLELFESFTISNCEIIQRSGVKTWGHLVFSASGKENGVYTIKNCTFNSNGNQGIYINEKTSGAVYNIENCTFNGNFGSADGAVTIQNNHGVAFTVNVTGCTFNTDSKKVCYLYNDPAFTLITDPTVTPVCLNR